LTDFRDFRELNFAESGEGSGRTVWDGNAMADSNRSLDNRFSSQRSFGQASTSKYCEEETRPDAWKYARVRKIGIVCAETGQEFASVKRWAMRSRRVASLPPGSKRR